jgi:two-component system, OmpR family, sensor histidine kinase BaeS
MVITAVQRTLPDPAGLVFDGHRTLSITTDATLYDFETDFIADTGGRRSVQRAIEPIVHFDGRRSGYVELSESPAYGTDVVNAVLRGWALASAAAVGLASLAGWWISRRISAPLLRLTDAAARMAAGDLQARARVRDGGLAGAEIRGLACTFDDMADRVAGTISALRAFVSDAAHEINTPLMALQNQLELAESSSGPAAALHIGHAHLQAGRLAELSRSLLDLSRLEADARSPLEAVDLGAAVREVCEAAASRADSRGIRLDLRLAETTAWITGAPQLVHQALANVLDNALKFTPEGGEVRVLMDEVAARARVQVLDTGIGIPDDEVHAVFDRFRRARNASAYAGNGLGLAIVRAIVELQGGTVTARNRDPGPGVCITLTWPTR